jgi:hypothetical protein
MYLYVGDNNCQFDWFFHGFYGVSAFRLRYRYESRDNFSHKCSRDKVLEQIEFLENSLESLAKVQNTSLMGDMLEIGHTKIIDTNDFQLELCFIR